MKDEHPDVCSETADADLTSFCEWSGEQRFLATRHFISVYIILKLHDAAV